MAILKLCKVDYLTENDVINVIDYIIHKNECVICGAKNIAVYSYDSSYISDQMIAPKVLYNQTNGRQFYHLVLSLQPFIVGAVYKDSNLSESTIQPDELDRLMTMFLSSEYLKEHQIIYGIHQQWKDNGTVNLHVHILINSVSLHGNKIELRKKQLWEYLSYLEYMAYGSFRKRFSQDSMVFY